MNSFIKRIVCCITCYLLFLKTQRTETQYIESFVPVNCASEMRKRPPSIYASTKGNVMQKAKVNTSVVTTLSCAMHQKADNANRTACCINGDHVKTFSPFLISQSLMSFIDYFGVLLLRSYMLQNRPVCVCV